MTIFENVLFCFKFYLDLCFGRLTSIILIAEYCLSVAELLSTVLNTTVQQFQYFNQDENETLPCTVTSLEGSIHLAKYTVMGNQGEK